MENGSNNFGVMAPKAPTGSNSNQLLKQTEGKPQTTSTPFHDNQNILPSHTGSIHEYFFNGSDINTSHNSPRNAPILGNITNVSTSTLNNQTDIISYQRVKRVVYENAESAEALLKHKENYLHHLKSIDLSKYSFPNENKPRTDYTYAKSSSYLKECKELANDNVEMPNLCRRARRSPSNSFLQSPSQSMLNESSTAKSMYESKEKLSVYEKLKSFVIPRKNSLQKDLSQELDDGDLRQPGDPIINRSPGRLVTETTSSVSAGPTYITTKSSVYQTEYPNSPEQPPIIRPIAIKKTTKRGCGLCLPLILVLLIPFMLYGLNKLDEKENLYEKINENYLKRYLDVKINEEKIDLYRQKVNQISNKFKFFFTNYLPEVFHLVKNKTSLIKDKIIDYKDATIGGFDLAKSFFTSKNEDLAQSLEDIKEKFLGETAATFEGSKLADKDLVRKEFDYIFNYTLNMMSNKLADQLIQSKQNYESELKQVKEVLRELDSRYKNLVNQLHEKKSTEIISDDISFQKIEEYINRSFFLYNADKTGMTDFASESVGGSILFTKCTEDYLDGSRWVTVLNVPITRLTISPRVVIQGSMQPGNCWAFKGDKADLFIKLAARIMPSSFSLEHIPKELSLTGVIDSAPQNFTVYGYASKDYISDDVRFLLGNYRYDNESRNTLQFFSVQHEYEKPISVVELKIESNAGNKDFTCLYKFRVHGKLFKQEKQQIDETKQEEKKSDSADRNEF